MDRLSPFRCSGPFILLPAILCCVGFNRSYSDEVLPRLIFTGNAAENKEVSLDEYNRIEFGDNSMFVKSKKDPSAVIELPYSDFSRFSVSEDLLSGVGLTEVNGSSIWWDAESGALHLDTNTTAVSEVRVFNLFGMQVMSAEMRGGDILELSSLPNGIYVATASCGDGIHKIKFVK